MEKTFAKPIRNLDITKLKLRNISKDGYYVYVQKREVKTSLFLLLILNHSLLIIIFY